MDAKERPFRVLIVGAGFGGLTLANVGYEMCLLIP